MRHYLDNAATSFPKPECVYAAVDDFNRRLGAAASRGNYAAAGEAGEIVQRCRRNIARLLNAEAADCIAFACNGTDALNIALHGLLRPGDHVVTTAAEHNSVLRPLRMLSEMGVSSTVVPSDATGRVEPGDVRAALRPNTRLVVVTHASNVTGTIQPVDDIAELAQAAGVLTLLDAAQTVGHLPIDLARLPVDLLAASGHKGLLGPLGTGVLYIRPGLETEVRPLRQGGTGTASEDDQHPAAMPHRLEAGNANLPGLAGLAAASEWLLEQDIAQLRRREIELTGRLLEALNALPKAQVYGPATVAARTGVVSLTAADWTPHDLAAVLDAEFRVEARAGLHCAPQIHGYLGTRDGGTLRLSLGAMTTPHDIDAVLAALDVLLA